MGFADRDYARPEYARVRPSGPGRAADALRRSGPVGVVLAALALFWLIGHLAVATGHGAGFGRHFALSAPGLREGRVWTLLTHALAHADFLHLLGNGLGLWFFGEAVRRERGARRFLAVFLGGVLAGGLAWAALWLPGGHPAPMVVGASAGVLALTAYHLADKLRDELTLLLFFVLPVTLEAGWLLVVAAGVSAFGLVGTEIPAATGWYRVIIADNTLAHSAHAGGLALGFLLNRLEARLRLRRAAGLRRGFTLRENAPTRPGGAERRFPGAAQAAPPPEALGPEVDRILDKINARGLGSLSPEERATLDRARETLRR